MTLTRITRLVAAALTLAVATQAGAQDNYPTGPVRLVVPFPAGGPASIVSFAIADKLGAALGQPVVVDNKPGAGGNLGADIVAKARPDGQTLLLGTNGPLVINASLYDKLPFDPRKDFQPITQIASIPLVLVAHPSLPIRTIPELIAYAKRHPGELNYSSSGSGSGGHLAGALLASMANVQMTHVPYKGAAPAVSDVVAGHVKLTFTGLLSVLPQIQAGKLRAIAVATPKRVSSAPDLPTIAESGLPGFEIVSWYGLLAPAGTPRPIVDRLHREVTRILALPDTREQLFVKGGLEHIGSTPEDFAATLRREMPQYTRIVQLAGAKAE